MLIDIAPKYHVEDNHPAIISKETFRLAQQVRAQKAATRVGENKNLHKYAAKYPYSAFIICSECGRTLKRRYWNYGTSAQRIMHQCGGYIEGKANCKAKATAHDVIEGATIQMLNEVFIDNIDIVPMIKSVIKKNILVTDEEKSIDDLLNKNDELQVMISNLLDMKLKNTELPESTYKQKYHELTEEIASNESMIKKLESDMLRTYDTKARIELINTELKKRTGHLTELNADLLHAFIYKMISVNPEEIVFCIAGKKNYDDKEFAEKRHQFLKNEPLAEGIHHNERLQKTIKYKVIVI